MCFGSGNTESRTIVQSNNLPGYVEQGGQENYEQAKEIADRPYEAYTGPRIADFSGTQSKAFDAVKGADGVWKPQVDKAKSMTATVGDTKFPEANVEAYMNPFLEGVLANSIDELSRQGSIDRNRIKSSAATRGAFDSARHGVVEAEQMRNEGLMRNRMITDMNAAGYDRAYAAYRDDEARDLEASKQLAALGQLDRDLRLSDAQALLDVGGMEQSMDQSHLDISYEDFLRQRDHPLEMLNMKMSALLNSPYSTQSKQISPYETSNQFAQNAGAFGALAGGLGMFSESGGFSGLWG